MSKFEQKATSPLNEQEEGSPLKSDTSHFGEASDENMPDALGLAGESVDFNSVLSAVSGNGTPNTADESSQKDLNISSVIANIQDEGPAAQKGASSAAVHEPSKRTHQSLPPADQHTADAVAQQAIEEPTSSAEPSDRSPPPMGSVEDASAISLATDSPAVPWATILMRLVVTLLVVNLAGMVYLLYRQGPGNQALQSGLLQLQQKLQEADASVAALNRQLQQQQTAMQDLVTAAQMRQHLEGQRQSIDAWLQSRMAEAQAKPVQPTELSPSVIQEQDKATSRVEPASTAETPPATSPVVDADNKVAPKRPKPEKEVGTELGQGSDAGRWLVHLASYGNRHQAEKALHKYASDLPDAVIQNALVKGKHVYRISVTGFSSKKDALAYRDRMQRELGLKGGWIAKNKKGKK